FRRMAAAAVLAAVGDSRRGHGAQRRSGRDLVHPESVVLLLPVRDGEGDGAALSLRPADAARLESVPSHIASLGRGDRRLGRLFSKAYVRAMAFLDRTARSIFFWEFLKAFWIALRYFFAPKAT